MKPHKISLFSCLYPAKSAQVHTPMANFAEKNHPLHHVRKHFSQQRAGEYQYIHRSRKSPDRLKMTLTVKEAAAYSNIGINKIERVLRTPNCPFVLYVGSKKLVKRKDFEEYIRKNLII